MKLDDEKRIESLKSKIIFWEAKLKNTCNAVDAGILDSKIIEAKKAIAEIEGRIDKKPRVVTSPDAPALLDRPKDDLSSVTVLTRGQVIDTRAGINMDF